MILFRKLMAWQKYLATQLALAETDEKRASGTLKRVEEQELAFAEGRTVTEKRAMAKGSVKVEEAADELHRQYAYRKLVEALYKGVEGDTFLCSRELSRRLGMTDRERRDARYHT